MLASVHVVSPSPMSLAMYSDLTGIRGWEAVVVGVDGLVGVAVTNDLCEAGSDGIRVDVLVGLVGLVGIAADKDEKHRSTPRVRSRGANASIAVLVLLC